jgi:hypothetical protein
VVTVLIGANDLASATSVREWLGSLYAYTDPLRAAGIKVAVGTILPQFHSGNHSYTQTFNSRRSEANQELRAAVGTRIDAVIDYAADPRMGPDGAAMDKGLYQDGVHPTDACGLDCGGQGRLAAIYAPTVDNLLKSD